jgi:processive 1,2-diacylglycerol beta-glucosyltransferase
MLDFSYSILVAMQPKKILILSVSAGAGHMRAAEAIRATAAINAPEIEVLHLDVMDFVSSAFRKLYTDFYIKLVNHAPALWGYLYSASNEAQTDSKREKVRQALERMNARPLKKAIADFAPDAIICTHFLPAEMLSRLIRKDRMTTPVWVQVTDFDLHRLWVHEHMSGYFAANDEVAYRMRAHGILAEKIHVVGIPIMPAFAQPLSRTTCAHEFGLDPAKPTILLMGGGAGLGSLDTVAGHLLAQNEAFQLIVLAGKNADALAHLQQLALRYPGRLLPQGFTNQVERLMACADLVITKPGGLTTSECLAMGLPMIVNAPIPGQEERNADFLLEQGVALKAFDEVTLAYRVQYLLAHPDKLAEMHNKAQLLGHPDCAAKVLQIVCNSQPSGLNLP